VKTWFQAFAFFQILNFYRYAEVGCPYDDTYLERESNAARGKAVVNA
jgi:hypothetical protein